MRFALEVHPGEIAYDIVTSHRTLEAINHREVFGFNFDPSHLHWQMVDPVQFLREFKDRIYHVHMKDAARQLDGRTSILGSHVKFGHPDRGWGLPLTGPRRRELRGNHPSLEPHPATRGPLSVEWEDTGMNREHGAKEALGVRQEN